MQDRRSRDGSQVRNLRSLLEVSKRLGAEILPEPLLQVILDQASEVMEADRASLFIHEEESATLLSRNSVDLAAGEVRIPLGVGLAGHVAQTGRSLNIPDAYADPRFNPEVDRRTGYRTHSVLCAPMSATDGRLIGVIQVLNKKDGGSFTADDEALLEAFASLAGISLDRARLVEAFVEKQRLEESLKLAHDIQMAMLPKQWPERGECEIGAALRPARSVGGDLYDFLEDGDRLWFLVGDVSGKGVGAALFMAVTKALLHGGFQAGASLDLVLSRANRELCRDNEQAMFVTAFVGCLDLRTGEVVHANAGHNPPYRLLQGGAVEAVTERSGLPLGIAEDQEYPTSSFRLERGDGLYLFTDGVTEGQDARGEAFTEERLIEVLRAGRGLSAAELVQSTLGALDGFAGGAPQYDDVTIMSVRYLGD